MPLFDKNKVEAKDILGMETEEFKKKLDSTVSKEDLESFKTGIVTSVAEQIKESLKALEGKGTQNNNQNQNQNQNTEEELDFVLDTENAIKKTVAQAVMPATQLALRSTAELTKRDVLEKLPYYHEKAFKKEIDELLSKQPINHLCNADFVKNCYDTVVGRHLDDIHSGTVKKRSEAFVEAGANNGNHVDTSGGGAKLTPEEETYAKRFGMTTEDYLKQKQAMRMVN